MRRLFGRAVEVLLVGLLAMSIIGVAATETFVNKTGHDVYGITVTFSTRVKITRHGYVFPDQDPSSGRSEQFTFSGGKLHNYQRFTIGWIPGTAQVVDYEWLEEEPTASSEVEEQTAPTQETSSSSAPSLPDPNTPPLLYGDDYPGPDEPLYQPKPDEEIWLTDLEGHEDIYDNDSIRINYAPGFDKSKVTKISVYRNGVYMRFLPEKFDVLTNAQMKTFDGNPMEHSPASSHTDHAIMGYEYEFDIYTADHLWILKKTVKSGFRWRPKEVWAETGINWHWGQLDRYSYDTIIQFFNYLRRDGFTGISIDMIYYVMTPADSNVFPQYTVDHSITNWEIVTPTTSELEKMLKAAEAAKMDVHVRGHLYISQQYQDEHGFSFSGDIDPTNPQEFFDSYTKLWLELVPLLNKYHVKLITPFTECDKIEKYPRLIKAMYTKISEQYKGEMGFEEATHNMLMGTSVINHTPIYNESAFAQLVRNFTFWDWKGSQGRPIVLEYSCQVPAVETQRDQRVSVMERNFIKLWKPAVNYYHFTYPDDPQMWGELGAHNTDGEFMGPEVYYNIPASRKVMDEQERADFILAALKATKKLGINAINLWGDFYFSDLWVPAAGRPNIITGHYNKPASPMYRVITAIIKPEEGD